MKSFIITIFLLFISLFSYSQGFIQPIESFVIGNESTIILNDGDTIRGKVVSGFFINGYLKVINLKDEQGQKFKFNADEVKAYIYKPHELAKYDAMNEASSSIKNLIKPILKKF